MKSAALPKHCRQPPEMTTNYSRALVANQIGHKWYELLPPHTEATEEAVRIRTGQGIRKKAKIPNGIHIN